MSLLLAVGGWILLGVIIGAGAAFAVAYRKFRGNVDAQTDRTLISGMIKSHFQPTSLGDITISERRFPFRVRADLQRTIDSLFGAETSIVHFCGVRKELVHRAPARRTRFITWPGASRDTRRSWSPPSKWACLAST
jgi:cell division protease FtsH